MNSRKTNAVVSTRTSSESGRDATENFSQAQCPAGFAGDPVLTIYLPTFRPPSLNEIIKQHWSRLQHLKARCSRLMKRAASSLQEATDQPGRLTLIILWEGLNSSATRSRKRYCAGHPMRRKTGSSGNTGRSLGAASKSKFTKIRKQQGNEK